MENIRGMEDFFIQMDVFMMVIMYNLSNKDRDNMNVKINYHKKSYKKLRKNGIMLEIWIKVWEAEWENGLTLKSLLMKVVSETIYSMVLVNSQEREKS